MKVLGIDDPRWEPALELLLSGAGSIALGDLVHIGWWTGGVNPHSDVRIHILSGTDPRFLSTAKAEQLISEGLDLVQAARKAHPQLNDLIECEPVRTDLVYDYGKGSVRTARVNEDRSINWEDSLVGREHGTREDEE